MLIDIELRGSASLLMHNPRLADPLDDMAKALKALNAKRSKTEDDHAAIKRAEWYGGMYFDKSMGGVVVPTSWLEASFKRGGSLYGKKGTVVERALLFLDEFVPLVFPFRGDRTDLDALWSDGGFIDTRAVVVQRNRVMRTRPIFREWALCASAMLDTAELDLAVFEDIADKSGQVVGIGTYRPKFGRFSAVVKPA